jgi:hypothetical protein
MDIAEDETRDLNERLECVVLSVINSLQDDISEDLRTPWPSTDGRTMAMPEVHSNGVSIRLWYGDERAPALNFPAILISDVTVA